MKHQPNTTTIRALGRALAIAAALFALSVPMLAHGGFDHVMGTVVKADMHSMTVKTAKGDVDVTLNDKTEITRADQKAAVSDLKPGTRVVVDVIEGSKDHLAHSVKVGGSAAPEAHGAHEEHHH